MHLFFQFKDLTRCKITKNNPNISNDISEKVQNYASEYNKYHDFIFPVFENTKHLSVVIDDVYKCIFINKNETLN